MVKQNTLNLNDAVWQTAISRVGHQVGEKYFLDTKLSADCTRLFDSPSLQEKVTKGRCDFTKLETESIGPQTL